MSDYYNPHKTYGLYVPGSPQPFKISRTKIDLFFKCPKCFYLDRACGVAQPPGYPFSLNAAVDRLLKKEFDLHRAKHTSHPLMKAYGVEAVPYDDPRMNQWRDSLHGGTSFLHRPTNLIISGGIDDLWINRAGELMIVDYKATAKGSEVNLDAEWQDGYKRQAEIYQWLFAQNGFEVSPTAYFVYCNGRADKKAFDGKLEFDVRLLPYTMAAKPPMIIYGALIRSKVRRISRKRLRSGLSAFGTVNLLQHLEVDFLGCHLLQKNRQVCHLMRM